MNKILFLLLFLLPFSCLGGKKKDKINHIFPSRWVEVKRLRPDSTVMDFKDTLFMTFQLRDTFTYRVRNGFVYRGKYTLDEDDHLDFGTRSYTLALKKPKSLILADANGIYYYVNDTSDTAQVIVLTPEEKILPVTDMDQMIGKWTVYKRVIDKDGGGIDYDLEIKSVYITGDGSDEKKGYLYCGKDGIDNPSYFITAFGGAQMLDCSGKKPRAVKVVKCQKGELILWESGVSYYCKQFK